MNGATSTGNDFAPRVDLFSVLIYPSFVFPFSNFLYWNCSVLDAPTFKETGYDQGNVYFPP